MPRLRHAAMLRCAASAFDADAARHGRFRHRPTNAAAIAAAAL